MASSRARGTADNTGYLLKRAQSALGTALSKALSEHGTTLPQYAVLVALDEEPGLSNADLARRAFITPQSMNQVLRELEARQLVLRQPHPAHGRLLPAHLTAQGDRVLRACRRAVDAVEKRMLDRLTPGQRRQLVVSLRTCIAALSD